MDSCKEFLRNVCNGYSFLQGRREPGLSSQFLNDHFSHLHLNLFIYTFLFILPTFSHYIYTYFINFTFIDLMPQNRTLGQHTPLTPLSSAMLFIRPSSNRFVASKRPASKRPTCTSKLPVQKGVSPKRPAPKVLQSKKKAWAVKLAVKIVSRHVLRTAMRA